MTPTGISDGVIAILYQMLCCCPHHPLVGVPVVHLAWVVLPQPIHEQITVLIRQMVLDDEQ